MHNDSIFVLEPPQEIISIPGKSLKKEVTYVPHEHNRLDRSNPGFISGTMWPIRQEVLM